MRKLVVLMLIFSICLSMIACESVKNTDPTQPPTDSDGNRIEYSERGKSVNIDNLPCTIEYNGSTFELTGIDMYESYSEETYSYFLYAVVSFDVSNLTDAEVHWLQKEDTMAYMLYDENRAEDEYDFTHMAELGSLYLTDTHELFYVFTPSYFTAYRDSFAGAYCSFSINVQQEETYVYDKDTDLNKEYRYAYSFDIPTDMADSESIERPLYDDRAKWLAT